ncbi:hypothetical protein AAHC03_019281 [Spirometra sp. Aus1]
MVYIKLPSTSADRKEGVMRSLRTAVCLRHLLRRFHSPKTAFFEGAYKASGALHERPILEKFGVLKSLAVALPFIYIGAMISMNGAAFLEEHDIFVPEDDD